MTRIELQTTNAIQSINRKMKDTTMIDWEQRRYEIAKEIFTRCLSSSDGEMRSFCAKNIEMHAEDCVREAGVLIAALKKSRQATRQTTPGFINKRRTITREEMMTYEDYVSFDQAQKLKRLGFDLECYNFYNPDKSLGVYSGLGCGNENRDWNNEFNERLAGAIASAPTLAQAAKWLRDIHKMHIEIDLHLDECYRFMIVNVNDHTHVMYYPELGLWWRSYEQALSAGIDKALKLLKEE